MGRAYRKGLATPPHQKRKPKSASACIMIPRMNSVLIVTDQYGLHLKKAFEKLKTQYPILELSEGVRT